MDKPIAKKPWIIRYLTYVIALTVALILIVYYIAFTDHSTKLKVETTKITIDTVKQNIFQDYIAVIGTVEPIQTIYLDATDGGRVEEIYLREGTMLKKGDGIMKLSNDGLMLEISNYEAQVSRTINDQKNMRVTLENQRNNNKRELINLYFDMLKLQRQYNYNKLLIEQQNISKEEFLLSKEDYERTKQHYELLLEKSARDSAFMTVQLKASEESVESMQRNLNLTRQRLNKLLITSPVNGELATLNSEIGEVINYGKRIGTINILDAYKLKVEIDEHYIQRITRNLTGQCEFSENSFKAQITKVYPEVKNGKFAVDMVFMGNLPKGIRIGQTTRIRLELGEPNTAILVPKGSFYQTTGGQWIFVVDPTGTFAVKQNIQVGRQNPVYYEITEGLEPGQKVIISGYEYFGDVQKLLLVN